MKKAPLKIYLFCLIVALLPSALIIQTGKVLLDTWVIWEIGTIDPAILALTALMAAMNIGSFFTLFLFTRIMLKPEQKSSGPAC